MIYQFLYYYFTIQFSRSLCFVLVSYCIIFYVHYTTFTYRPNNISKAKSLCFSVARQKLAGPTSDEEEAATVIQKREYSP